MPPASPSKRSRSHGVSPLLSLPNVGPAAAADLLRLGVKTPAALARCDAAQLYRRLGALDGRLHDPCVLDVFAAAIDYARGGPARPWWEYSRERRGRAGPPRP